MIVNLIRILHFIIVVSLILSVIIPNKQIKKYAFAVLFLIFIQHITNYGKCGLTEIEYLFMGEKYKEGFIYRLVKPLITVPEKYFDNYLFYGHIIWLVVLWYQLNN